jgi:hypothetical protein
MVHKTLTTLIAIVLIVTVSMLLAPMLGLGPEEFWIVPLVLGGVTLGIYHWQRRQAVKR